MQDSAWRHSETRTISPFLISRSALREVGFRTSEDNDFTKVDPCVVTLEQEQVHGEGFAPEFEFSVDVQALQEEADVSAHDLQLSVVLRNPALWSSHALASWPIPALPERYRIPKDAIAATGCQRGLQISLLVTPERDLEARFRRASRRGQIIARRDFVFAPPVDGMGFPTQVVPAEAFVSRGLPKDAVWYIDWIDWLDFDKAPEDILSVFLNEDVAGKLLQVAENDALGNVLWRSIASEAMLEICLKIFGSDPSPPEDPSGLLARLLGMMQAAGATELDGLVMRAKSTEGWRYFRTHLQSAFELGNKAKSLNFGGRKR